MMDPRFAPLDFLKLLLEPERLAVVGLVALGPVAAERLCAETGQPRRAVLATLAPLLQAGVIEETSDGYHVVPDALRQLARALPQPEPPDRLVFAGMTEQEGTVLARFFRGEQLVEIPAARAKRRVVLERIALDFEPGRHYEEAEVNKLLQRYHPDYAALRRHLVDEGFLDRERGRYWRAGGRVETGEGTS